MKTPDLISYFEYKGHVDVAWYDVLSKDAIPDIPWHQVYIIGDYQGRVPLVVYPEARDNLPGGGVERGESLERAMARETEEEINMRIVRWEPLGYQVCTHRGTGEVSNQFRAYAKLEKIADFTNDPGGSVIGYKLVDLEKLNEYIDYGIVGERLTANTRRYFKSTNKIPAS